MEEDRKESSKKQSCYPGDIAELEEAVKVLDSSLTQIKWRLKPSTRRRLELDILALSTGMRPVVMVDYGGKMPELQHHLCSLLKLCQKLSPIFEYLKAMVIQDMIYLIHVRGLAEHVRSTLNSEVKLLFVDLEQEPPQMIREVEQSPLALQLISIQKLFSSIFTHEGTCNLSSSQGTELMDNSPSTSSQIFYSQSTECIDLSNCMEDSKVTIPTLNGWLLGYPVVYLFSKEHIADAIYNLSTKYLHIFQVSICRNNTLKKGSQAEELLSFTVPYDLSTRGSSEQWVECFMAHMRAKWGRCAYAWKFLKMEVDECHPQAIVL
ncbi:uncharacterized protein LOC114739431 isoform X1 [Neltuma alba]|uniref:uncharacterized protein LOC114739431 isoform X1 n=1 Tax=Neltuma alba TaxID=207710 RepID=UPI0010A48A1A|nr:uncharacterized protein LOC114739431 isoform X1 [Prosopis alba]